MKFLFVAVLALIATLVYFLYEPVREFKRIPSRHVSSRFSYPEIEYDPAKRTVILLADNKGTEIFDLVAPYHLFKRTGQFNVFIVQFSRKFFPGCNIYNLCNEKFYGVVCIPDW